MAWVFSNWPGYFDFGLGIFRGLGTIGPSPFVRAVENGAFFCNDASSRSR